MAENTSVSVGLAEIKKLPKITEDLVKKKFQEIFKLVVEPTDLLFLMDKNLSAEKLTELVQNRIIDNSKLAPSKDTLTSFLGDLKKIREIKQKNVLEKFSGTFGISAKAVDLLLVQYLKSAANLNNPMIQDFLQSDPNENSLSLNYRKFAKAARLVNAFKISADP